MKKNKELSFEDLTEYVKEIDLIDKETAFRIFEFVANDAGYFKDGFDPYRSTNELFYNLLFDYDGNPHWYIRDFLGDYIETKKCDWASDLVKLYHFIYITEIIQQFMHGDNKAKTGR